MVNTLLAAEGIIKYFSLRGGTVRAVDGVFLTIGEGETLGLVGESGCGKSTLGRVLIRLIEPSAGKIYLSGQDIIGLAGKELRAARRGMQIIFQDPYGALNPRMAVEEIIMEPLLIHGARADAATRQVVARMLDRVGLSADAAHRYPHEFSGGQRQRIGIARALVLQPKFIVCDEPVSALDVSVQAQIVNLLQDLQAEFSLTYLFIAHDLGVVKHISSRVAVMYLGRIVEIAPKLLLYAAPKHPYTQALIAAVPVAHPRQRGAARAGRKKLSGDIPSAMHVPHGCRFHPRCPYVMAVCRTQDPPLIETAPGHQAACHLLEMQPP
jgi:oligopeptide/dipeptide ABC transporter ATP-binding protein